MKMEIQIGWKLFKGSQIWKWRKIIVHCRKFFGEWMDWYHYILSGNLKIIQSEAYKPISF